MNHAMGIVTTIGAGAVLTALLAAPVTPTPETTPTPVKTPRPRSVTLEPRTVVQGGTVKISTVCFWQDHERSSEATAVSDAFGTLPMRQVRFTNTMIMLEADATVYPNARPGRHAVSAGCPGVQATTVLTVVAKPVVRQPEPRPQTSRTPSGAPETGAGGTATGSAAGGTVGGLVWTVLVPGGAS